MKKCFLIIFLILFICSCRPSPEKAARQFLMIADYTFSNGFDALVHNPLAGIYTVYLDKINKRQKITENDLAILLPGLETIPQGADVIIDIVSHLKTLSPETMDLQKQIIQCSQNYKNFAKDFSDFLQYRASNYKNTDIEDLYKQKKTVLETMNKIKAKYNILDS